MADDVRFRPARPDDARFVWDVNNDPTVRAQSISTDPIPWESHQAWFSDALERSTRYLWIVEVASEPAGVVRFDVDGDAATISVALQAAYRGRGLGTKLIDRACHALADTGLAGRIIALVRPDNAPSMLAFERAGFALQRSIKQDDLELNEYHWERTREDD